MRDWRKLALALTLALSLAITSGAVAEKPVVVYLPGPVFQFDGGFAPKKLPKFEMAPVALSLSSRVHPSDETRPPALREVTLDLDRNTAVNAVGLPACGRRGLEVRGIEAARRACRESIVGAGVAHVMVGSPQSKVIELPLTLFNGGVRGGVTTLFIHSSIAMLNPAPAIATLKLRKASKGVFGLEAVATIPPIVREAGSVLDFSFEVKRLFGYNGLRSSYAVARCADERLLARETMVFVDGTRVNGTLLRSCTQRPSPGS